MGLDKHNKYQLPIRPLFCCFTVLMFIVLFETVLRQSIALHSHYLLTICNKTIFVVSSSLNIVLQVLGSIK